MTTSLPQAVLDVLTSFTSLQIGNVTIPCLYYNNKRQQIRAGLRVSIGKGSPTEIVEEAEILASRDGIKLNTLDEDMIRMFLHKHHLGIDCSAFAYYVLDALVQYNTHKPLKSYLQFPYANSLLRRLLSRLRPIENTNVKTLAHESNSTEIKLADVQPGDIITVLEGGRDHAWYHVLIVSDVTNEGNRPTALTYMHAYQWSTDGQYHHGVRSGSITIKDSTTSILDQTWTELGKIGIDNETFRNSQKARTVQLRRLNCLV